MLLRVEDARSLVCAASLSVSYRSLLFADIGLERERHSASGKMMMRERREVGRGQVAQLLLLRHS
jgi:hypothetical protein